MFYRRVSIYGVVIMGTYDLLTSVCTDHEQARSVMCCLLTLSVRISLQWWSGSHRRVLWDQHDDRAFEG